MIFLDSITKTYRSSVGKKIVFKDLTFQFPENKNIALIGRNGAGKSTLMRMLAGLDTPDSGRIRTESSISWPVGLKNGLQGAITGRENVKFVARIHGAKGSEMARIIKYVYDFSEIGDYFDKPVNTYSSGMRGRLAFGLSLAFNFDYYLVDEAMSVGDAQFKKKASEAFKEKIGQSNIILVTHGMTQVKTFCDVVVLVRNGKLQLFNDVAEGIAEYKKA